LCALDDVPPGLVDRFKSLGFTGKLFHDVWGIKNGLQILPLLLTLNPLLNHIRNVEKGGAPVLYLLLKWLLEGREGQSLSKSLMLVQEVDTFIEAKHSACSRITEGLTCQENLKPFTFHSGHRGLDIVLLASTLTNLTDLVVPLKQIHIQDVLECKTLVWFNLKAHRFGYLLPVTVLQTFGSESNSHIDKYLEGLNLLFDDHRDLLNAWELFALELSDDFIHGLLGVINTLG